MCTYLIEQGADVNAFRGIVPSTPLHWAAREGLVKVIDLLIQRGANPRLVDPQDFSCLHGSHAAALGSTTRRRALD